mgnify:CR=1 FL=1
MKKILLVGVVLVGVLLLFPMFTEGLSIAEFKALTDEELQEWNYETTGTSVDGIDTCYHFEMDVYRYYQPDNTMRLEREPFSFCLCFHESTTFENEVAILQQDIFNEYKELQDEL